MGSGPCKPLLPEARILGHEERTQAWHRNGLGAFSLLSGDKDPTEGQLRPFYLEVSSKPLKEC